MRAVTDTMYVPAARFVSRYAPSASDFVEAAPPPPARIALIVAAGKGSPDTRSVTRPLIVPDCANVGRAEKARMSAAHRAPRTNEGADSTRPRGLNVVDMHSLQGGNKQAGLRRPEGEHDLTAGRRNYKYVFCRSHCTF
jgi:hypothetical protein